MRARVQGNLNSLVLAAIGIAALGIGLTQLAKGPSNGAAPAWGTGPSPGPADNDPSPTPSPWPTPKSCIENDAVCGWSFVADLDGDASADQVVLEVARAESGFAQSAELRARLATGGTSSLGLQLPGDSLPMPAPELWAASGKDAGVFDLDGDRRDELLISPTSGGPRVYLHVFVWDDGLQEVSLDGVPFQIVVGGSTGAGGGLSCNDLDGDPELELVIRSYEYAEDPTYYNTREAVFQLDGAIAHRVGEGTTDSIPAADLDDRYNSIRCGD